MIIKSGPVFFVGFLGGNCTRPSFKQLLSITKKILDYVDHVCNFESHFAFLSLPTIAKCKSASEKKCSPLPPKEYRHKFRMPLK